MLESENTIHAAGFCLECAQGDALQLQLPVLRRVLAPLGNCARSEFEQLRQLERSTRVFDSFDCFHALNLSTLKTQ